ncbi:MAG: hypothetical protein NTX95_04160 [Actinobacteria bacterium]|nr:hypothetical protein [Actinomycetota bacterium]
MTQRPIFDYLATFGFGYFFGLGGLALMHFFTAWPATYQDAALMALISGAGAVGARLYNRRAARPVDGE